ncbi:MAG: type II toxin-antitoxin system Phd/YefM family antitoxin [Candidatus Schekmanbacteria bacterium]|nr:type II toxin-antitoxin system Phd/YefM family antitoxin [Candidatus Schekmanbacteria bacterium]
MKPQVLEKDGKKEFVVMTYEDFVEMSESLEDYEDLKELRKAKKAARKEKPVPFEQALKELGLN